MQILHNFLPSFSTLRNFGQIFAITKFFALEINFRQRQNFSVWYFTYCACQCFVSVNSSFAHAPPPAQSWALCNLDIWWLIPHYRAKGFSQVCTTYESKPKGKGGMGTAEINSYITGENWQAFGIWHAPMNRKFNINILSVWLMHVFRLQGRVFLISQLSSPWEWGIWCHLNEKCEIPLGLPIPHAGAYHWHVQNMENVHRNVTLLGKKANSVTHFWCKPAYH